MPVHPQARVSEKKKEEKEITSKDLTKSQLLLYILNDFLRGFYIVGCLFLNGLVILQMYSFIPQNGFSVGLFSNLWIRIIIFSAAIILLEAFAIIWEIKIYRRIWPKGSLFIGGLKSDFERAK